MSVKEIWYTTINGERMQYQADCDQCDWKGDLRYSKHNAVADSFLHKKHHLDFPQENAS